METALTIYPNNKEDANLYRQLAKRLKNRIDEKTVIEAKKAAKNKQDILNDISESITEMKLHRQGKLHLKSAKELLDEL
jgi:hypothetical protein